MTGDAKTNIFGYYSNHGTPGELNWMVNETVKRVIEAAPQSNDLQQVSYSDDTTPL